MQYPMETSRTCEHTFAADAFDKIDAFCQAVNIHVSPSKNDLVTVAWDETERWRMSLEVRDGCLVLTEKDRSDLFSIRELLFSQPRMDLYIGLPKAYEGSLQLETSAGSLYMSDLDSLRQVDLRTLSGRVEIGRVYTMDGFYANCNNGSLMLHNMATKGAVSLSCGTGSIVGKNIATDDACTIVCLAGRCTVSTLQAATRIAVEGNTGIIALNGVQAHNINAKITATGVMEIDRLYVEDCIRMHTASGSILCNIDDDIGLYTSYCRANYGSCNFPDISGNGPKRIHIMTNTGRVQVNFQGQTAAIS